MNVKTVKIALACLLAFNFSDRTFAYDFTPTTNPQTVTTNISFSAGNNTFTIPTGYVSTFSGVLSNASAASPGTLVKTGSGTLVLSGANTYTGGTTLNAGTIQLGSNAGLGTWPTSATDGNVQGLVTISGTATIATIANRTISNRFSVAAAAVFNFNVASGTTLTIQNVNNVGTLTNSYGAVLSTSVLGSVPIFSGGGNLVAQENESSFGGAFSSQGGSGTIGFDLTELASARFLNNTASAGNGGAVYAVATGTGVVSLDFGDRVVISGNSATTTGTSGDGGGIYAYSGNGTTVSFGTMTTFANNVANRYGGAIFAYAVTAGYSADVTLGTNTLFDSNISKVAAAAQAGGGALHSSHDATISGNSLFRNNLAVSYGGAVFMKGREAGTLLLDTTAGDIGFTGNYMSVTNLASPTTGVANSVYLDTLTAMQIQGSHNVFFDDPIASSNKAGNKMVLGTASGVGAFSGFVQLKGVSTVQNNFAAQINTGTLHFATGAQLTGATAGSFTLGAAGTLAGTGTIGFNANTLSGTIAADSATFTMGTWSDTTNSFAAGTGKTTVAAGTAETVGTLTFTGATKFDGATILVDLYGGNYDRIVVNNTVTFGTTNNNVILIKDAVIGGTYNIITSTTAAVGANPAQYFSVTGNISGLTGFSRYGAKVQYGTANGITNSVVQVAIGATPGNTTLYWTGITNNQWVSGLATTDPQNWTDVPGGTPSETRFLNGDRVIFDTDHTVGPFSVSIPTPVTVADMTVTGSGNYTITGNITTQTTGTTVTAPTGRLVKSGTGMLTLDGTNNFTGGVGITGGTVKAESAASVAGGTVTMANNSTLQFDNLTGGTFASSIIGDGNLVKSDLGTLTLNGSNSYTGSTNITAGTLVGNIASGTALTVNSGATYQAGTANRTVSSLNGTGTVNMVSQSLTVGTGDFSDGTITNVGTLTKTGAGTFTVGQTSGGNLDHQAGTFIIAEDKSVVLTGTANIADGTTLGIGVGDGANPSLTATGTVTIGDNTTINITGYDQVINAEMLLIHSDVEIVGGVESTGTVYTVGGTVISDDITLQQFINGLNVEKKNSDQDLYITSGGLVWNNDGTSNDAHGNFYVASGATATISELLQNNSNTDALDEFNWDGETLTKTGSGTLTLGSSSSFNGVNTYTGNTNITAGTLIATNIQSLGNGGQANIGAGASLVLNYTGASAFNYEITGVGNLTVQKNVLIDRDNSGFTGTTTISSGLLTMQNEAALGTSAIANNSALTLDFDGEFANSMTGTGSLIVASNRTVDVSGTSTFSGTTTINTNTVVNMNNASALGTSDITFADNTGDLNLDFDGTFANAIIGGGDLTVNGDIAIGRANMGFYGNTTIASGNSLTLNNFAGIGNTVIQTTTNNGSFVFDLSGTGTNYFVQNITGSGTLTKNGAGTVILNGVNDYTGKTTVNAGILVVDLAPAIPVTMPCGTELEVASGSIYRALSRRQYVSNLTGAGTVDMNSYDLDICSGDFSNGTIAGVGTLTKTSDGTATTLTVGTVSAVNLDHTIGALNIASGKTVALTGNATIQDDAIMGVGANTALTANGNVSIGADTTLNVTGYTSSMGTVVLIDAGSNIANEFGTYTVNGTDQRTTISLANYINTSPIVQRNKADMSQIIISVGGLVWNNTAPGTAHGTFNVTGNATVNGNLENNTVPGAGFNGWDGTTLTKTGNGTLTLTGNNTYTGDTNIDGGRIIGTNGNAFGDGTGTIRLNGTDTSVEYNIGGGTETAANDITGTGSFTKSGDGTLIHTGNSTYTGMTTVGGGTLVGNLVTADPVNLPCGAPLVVSAGATYQTHNSDQSMSSLTGAGTVNMNAYDGSGNKNLTVCSGDFSDGTLLNVSTLTKKNANTSFTIGTATVGNLNLAEGTLIIDTTEKLTVSGATAIGDNAMLSIAALPALTTGSLAIGNGVILDICGCSAEGVVIVSQTPIVGDFADYYVGGVKIEDDMSIDKFLNSLIIQREDSSNNPAYPGTQIRVTNGGLVWNNLEPNSSHGTFNISTTFKIIQQLTDRDDVPGFQPFTDPTTGQTWDGKTLTKKGNGILTLANGSNSYSGGTNIEAGRVVVEVAGSLGIGGVRNSGILEYNLTGDGTMSNDVSGIGSVVKNGTGMTTVTGTNTYTGGTTVNRGTLISNLAAPTSAFPCGTALTVVAGATYSPYNADQFVSSLTGAGTVDMKSYNLTVCSGDFSGGLITGVGTLTKTSPSMGAPTDLTVGNVSDGNLDLQIGRLTIAGGKAVTLAGNANIESSTALIVTAGSNPALTAGGSLTLGNGTQLNVLGYDASMGTVVLIDAGTDIANDFGTYQIDGVNQSTSITLANYRDTSPLIQRNATDLSQIIIGSGGLVWNNTAPNTAHGTFNVTGIDTITENLNDNPVDTAYAFGWDGKTLTKTGTGNLILEGDNGYTGGTVIEDGTVTAGNENSMGTGAVDIAPNGTLALGFDGTFNNTLQGTGVVDVGGNINIVKSNTGFTGTVNVTTGTTTLQRPDGLGGSAINLEDGTTLNFNTASSGTSTNTITGKGNLVKNGAGTLTMQNDLGHTGTTTVRGGTLVANLVPADPVMLPCGAALTVDAGATYRALNRAQFVSYLSGPGTVDMNGYDLTVCSGDFSGGTFTNLNNVTKKSTGTLSVGGFSAANLILQEGTLSLAPGNVVTLTGTATIGANTIFDIGAHLALDVDGGITIDDTAVLNVTGYSGTGSIVLVHSDTGITGDFGAYTVNGVRVTEQEPSLDQYYIVDSIINTGDEIIITDSYLAWNGPYENSAHGTFKIDSGTVTISDPLNDNIDDPQKWLTDENGIPLWDGVTLTKNGNGTLVLGNENTYTGNTIVNGGSIVATGENSLGAGSGIVKLTDNNASLILRYTADGVFSKKVTNGGTIRKTDGNTLTVVSDLSEMTGVFRQDDGTVIFRPVNNGFAGSYDQRGGTFEGTDGLTIAGNANFEAIVRPNGILNVGGDVTLDGADFYTNLYWNENYPQPAADVINGNRIYVENSTLHVNDKGVVSSYLDGGSVQFVVLHSENGITGDFATVTGITNLFRETHGVVGNDYVIELTLRDNPLRPYAPNHNTQEVVDTIQGGFDDPDLGPLVDDLLNMNTDDEIANAIDTLRGTEIVADGLTMALWSPWRSVFNRLNDDQRTKSTVDPCKPVDCGRKNVRNAWFEGYYRDENVSGDTNARGYDGRRGGIMTGLDTQLGRRFTLGAMFGYGEPKISSPFGKIEADDFTMALYGNVRLNSKWRVNGFLGYGRQEFDYRRTDFAGSYRAKYDGDAMYAGVELVRPMKPRPWATLLPIFGVDFQKSWADAFTESLVTPDAGYAQSVRKADLGQTSLRFGLNGVFRRGQRFDLNTRLQYIRQVGGNTHGTVDASFAMAPNSRAMNLYGVDMGRDRLNVGLGGLYRFGRQDRSSVFVDYDFDRAEHYQAHTGQVGFTTRW